MIPPSLDDAVLHRSFVSVYGQHGLVGAGVLISDSLVLTCAHVVNSALGRSQFDASTPPTGEMVRLRMPHVARDQDLSAGVTPGLWRPPRAHAAHEGTVVAGLYPYFGDLAVLKLAAPPPQGAEPAPFLPERDGNEVVALWASGNTVTTVRALPRTVTGAWTVLDVTAGTVHPGFSGGPLWDRSRGAVVGIVVATHQNASGETSVMGPVYAIGVPSIEAELPALPPVQVPTARQGVQRVLAALERLLPGTEGVVRCEERLSAKLSRESAGQGADHYRLLSLALGVRRGVPALLGVVGEYLTDSGTRYDSRDAWDALVHAARTVSPDEILTTAQRRDLVGLLALCEAADPGDLVREVLPYVEAPPLVCGLVDLTDLVEGYPPPSHPLIPLLLQTVVRICLAEQSAGNCVATDLNAWVSRMVRQLNVSEAAVDQFREDLRSTPVSPRAGRAAAPRIQVELLPVPPGQRFTYQIWVCDGTGRHEVVLVQDSEVASDKVVEGVRTVLRSEVNEQAEQALVEFFVAPPWLSLDVDTWHLQGAEDDDFLLGVMRRVVLRSSGRTRDSFAGWKRRTEALASSNPLVLDQESVGPFVAQAKLEAEPDVGVVIMCCEQRDQIKVLRQCLQAGVHTVLWHRQDHDTETVKQLLDLMEGISHTELPETVRRQRIKALADPDCPAHQGRQLSLLYDGPDHRPPPLAPDAWALTQH
ncbi:trypsin-like peptidase domain-containing protein [Streptomyces sp. SID5606]|uniref:VMAP-C domain-containing protein n=1 Tax=Streptomyces sp. SID5606 TaxID=2690305 RepID=UPI0031F80644